MKRTRMLIRTALLASATAWAACSSDNPGGPTVTVSTVTLDLTTSTLSIGGSVQLTATARDASGNVVTTTFTWSSSRLAVATVNSTGLVSAVAPGTAEITATAEGQTGVTTVTVEVPDRTLTITASGIGDGTVTSSPAGIDCTITGGTASGACTSGFAENSTVALTVTGSGFNGWTGGGCSGTAPTCDVLMDQDHTVTLDFVVITHPLTVLGGGDGDGTVTSTPTGINCTITDGTAAASGCASSFSEGTQITLNQTSATGSTFTSWSGACSGSGACVVTLNQAESVTATFTKDPKTLTVLGSGTGDGTVTSSPAGVSCTISAGAASGTCSFDFAHGTQVTLNHTESAGSFFVDWAGACGPATCVLTMDQTRTVTATFDLGFDLTITGSGTGDGNVISSPAGIDCDIASGTASGACSENFAPGTQVSLTPSATSPNQFTGWGGACSGPTVPCVVTMDANRTVDAQFDVIKHTLTVQGAGLGDGNVSTVRNTIIDCDIASGVATGPSCTNDYVEGTYRINLAATADPGSVFSGWGGDCVVVAGECEVRPTGPLSVIATFNLLAPVGPTIFNGTQTLLVTNDPTCGNLGSRFQVGFDYTDPNGDVLPAGTLLVVFVDDLGGGGTLGPFSNGQSGVVISGDGFSGSVSYLPCAFYGSASLFTLTHTLTDGAQNASNQLQVLLPRPPTGNLRADDGGERGSLMIAPR